MKTYIAYINGVQVDPNSGSRAAWRWESAPQQTFAAATAALDAGRRLAPALSHVTIERYGVTTAPPVEGS